MIRFGLASAQFLYNKRGCTQKNDLHHNPMFSTTSEKSFCLPERHLAKSSLTSRLSASLIAAPENGAAFFDTGRAILYPVWIFQCGYSSHFPGGSNEGLLPGLA